MSYDRSNDFFMKGLHIKVISGDLNEIICNV